MAADTTVVNAKGKAIVYVDTDSLMADYEYSKKVQALLLDKKTAMENRIKGAQSALENKYKEYQNKAAYLTPGEAQKAENDIKNMQIDGENLAYKLQSGIRPLCLLSQYRIQDPRRKIRGSRWVRFV